MMVRLSPYLNLKTFFSKKVGETGIDEEVPKGFEKFAR
jgi:hypothetical protein